MSTETTSAQAWDALVQRCRDLAELAELAASLAVVSESTSPTAAAEALREMHEQVDVAAQAVQQSAGACRRSTYQTLRGRGMQNVQIADAFQCSKTAVGYVFSPEKRVR